MSNATRPRLPSIRQRLTQSLLWTALAFGTLTAAIVWGVLGHEIDELMDQELRETAEIIHNIMVERPHERLENDILAQPHDEYEEHLVWQVVNTRNQTLVARSHKAPDTPLLAAHVQSITTTPDGRWHAVTFDFKQVAHQRLIVAQSNVERQEARLEAVLYTFLAALAMGLLATAVMNWRIRRELAPLQSLSQQLQAYDPLRPDTPPRSAPRHELAPIEHSIQMLGQRLAQRVASERAFNAHAAHALRTPVAGLDAQLSMAIKEVPEHHRARLVRAREANARLGRVMQALLTMFRSGAQASTRLVRLADLLDLEACTGLTVQLQDDGPLQADPDLLSAVLLNLLDNARASHARQVSVSALREHGACVLRVQDDGEGCSPDKRSELSDALARQDYTLPGRSGGLGLALADLVVRAHGGQLVLPPVANGFCVELRWPATP